MGGGAVSELRDASDGIEDVCRMRMSKIRKYDERSPGKLSERWHRQRGQEAFPDASLGRPKGIRGQLALGGGPISP